MWRRRWHRDEGGVAVLEFSLVLPVFLLLIVGLMEFALVENSRNTVNFAARDGSMIAAEGGNGIGTDCMVLNTIDNDILSPARNVRIIRIDIFWSDVNGNLVGSSYQRYTRGGNTTCTYGDGSTLSVPYTLSVAGYPEAERCVTLAGCGSPHTTLDIIGVTVVYEHFWTTTFPKITGSNSVILSSTTITRMEPQL